MSGNQTQTAEAIENIHDLANPVDNSADVHGGGDEVIIDESQSSFIIEIPEKEVPNSKGVAPRMEDKQMENEIVNYVIAEEEVNSSVSSINAEEKFKYLYDALTKEECQPKIQKVASVLRDNKNFKKYYKPKMVSIGPYYHGNSKLKVSEMLKLKLAALFFEEHNLSKDVLYYKIRRDIKDLRMCYEKEAVERFNDDDLAWMFFLDGCAVLQYIYAVMPENKKRLKELKIKDDHLAFARQDFFLLENQIPYRVLELLIKCLSNKSEEMMRKGISKFIFDSIKAPGEKEHLENQLKIKENPAHLLDILRAALLQSVDESQISCSKFQRKIMKYLIGDIGEALEKFKNFIKFVGKSVKNLLCTDTRTDLYSFRNIKELRAAGVRLRPSNTGRLTDITFHLGILKVPPIIVDDLTAAKFLNLVAYEMCPDFVNDFGVSSYISFLDALIDQAQDVKELRDKQILYNFLGSNGEVAKLFNEISTNLVHIPSNYADVKREIQEYYDNKWLGWLAEFNHDHFQNPWSILAFAAAIIALVSSIVQTVYTVLGYHKELQHPL